MDGSGPGSATERQRRRWTHLVGLSAQGMPGLAQLLLERGLNVSASDPNSTNHPPVESLKRLGLRIHDGHRPRHFTQAASLLVHAPEVGRDHTERLRALRRGVPQKTPSECLDPLIHSQFGLGVVGQREASVASAMIAWTLSRAGWDPSVYLGRSAPQLGGWARAGHGPHFVFETLGPAEAVGPLGPRVAVVLKPRPARDGSIVAQDDSLKEFIRSVPREGKIFATRENWRLHEAMRAADAPVEWLSLNEPSGWWGADLREHRGQFRFRAFHQGRFTVEIRLRVTGRRNVLSALATVAVCEYLAVPTAEIKEGLEEFSGVSGDFESRGSYRGVTLVHDEAQTVQGVAETLAIGRQVFGARRLWVVFSPDEDGLTASGVERYLSALGLADCVVIQPRGAVTTETRTAWTDLAQALHWAGVGATLVTGLEEAVSVLDQHLKPGDVLLTLGPGEVGTISDAFIRRLSRDRQDR